MKRLAKILYAWGSPRFEEVLKEELLSFGAQDLFLQSGLRQSSYALDRGIQPAVLSVEEKEGFLKIKLAVYYFGIMPGCGCANDPMPEMEYPEYCEREIRISKLSGEAEVKILD